MPSAHASQDVEIPKHLSVQTADAHILMSVELKAKSPLSRGLCSLLSVHWPAALHMHHVLLMLSPAVWQASDCSLTKVTPPEQKSLRLDLHGGFAISRLMSLCASLDLSKHASYILRSHHM